MAESDPRKRLAQELKDMYSAGSLDPLKMKGGLPQELQDSATSLGITDENLNKFLSKLGTPVERLRRQVRARRNQRAEAMQKAREPDAVSGREPMRTSLVTTGLRDEFGNPYRRSVDTPGAQARRRIREAERAGDVSGASALRRDPAAGADRGTRTQDDAQVDRARGIQKQQDAERAEDAAGKNERGAKRTARQLKKELRKLKEEKKNRRGQGKNKDR